jgi:hypothetical protein
VTEGTSQSDINSSDLTEDRRLSHYVDMWKQSVETQQHFNTIEWQIRGLALTVATFALGASGWVAKDGSAIGPISLGAVAALAGLILWYAFYFVDRHWYHPLLKAAVEHGSVIEDEIKKSLPQAGMTRTITARSAYKPRGIVRLLSRMKKGDEMHSDDKLAWFYKIGGFALVLAVLGLQIAALLSPVKAAPQQIVVTISQGPSGASTPR